MTPARVVVVAAPGYGKTHAAALSVPDALVVDDIDRLATDELRKALAAIAAHPEGHAIVVTAREPLPPDLRAGLPGRFHERGPSDLALDPRGVSEVLHEDYGISDPQVGATLHDLTAGWPALVHFGGDAIARSGHAALPHALTDPDSACAQWVFGTVLSNIPGVLVDALARLHPYDPVTPALWSHVCRVLGHPLPPTSVDYLRRIGLLVPHRRAVLTGASLLSVVPVIAGILRAAVPDDAATPAWHAAAAHWFADNDEPYAAAHALVAAGRLPSAADVIATHGARILAHGDADRLTALVAAHPSLSRPPSADQSRAVHAAFAEALHLAGHTDEARRAFRPLVVAAGSSAWPVELATRVGALHHTLGELPQALSALDRIAPASLRDDAASVRWHATRANVASMLGHEKAAAADAETALDLAEALGDDDALTTARQAMAKVSRGTRKEAHLAAAAAAARRSSDVLALARILGNQSFTLLAAARYADALPVCRDAVLAAQLARPTGALSAALHNYGEALTRTGQFDEARWQLGRSVSLCRQTLPGRAASGLAGLGELHRTLGHDEQARAAYEEAVALARESGEHQVLVPALSGLARLLARGDEAERARAIALTDESSAIATGGLVAIAQIATGWVALAGDDRVGAHTAAEHALIAARADESRDLLAEALELMAAATRDPRQAADRYREAWTIWTDGGATPAADRIVVALARLPDADATTRSKGREATSRLIAVGFRTLDGISLTDAPNRPVVIRVLGGFQVTVEGDPVPMAAWRSRQARTMVKYLAARRGRPVTRGHLCELLWPGDDSSKTGHRLSVLMATVRGAFDPAKRWPPERFLAADSVGVWLDLRHVAVDADGLIEDATEAARLLTAGEVSLAREILTDIDGRYRGEALEEDPYEDWADQLREECRAAWIRSVRHLAMLHAREGSPNEAAALFVRLLAVDPYDERVHRAYVRALLAAGRHGEAQRAFTRWADAMAAIDAPPPDPRILRRSAARS